MASRQGQGSGRGTKPEPRPAAGPDSSATSRQPQGQAPPQRTSTLPHSAPDRPSAVLQHSRRQRTGGSPGGSSDSGSTKAPSPSERRPSMSAVDQRGRAEARQGRDIPRDEGEMYVREPMIPSNREVAFAARTELQPRGKFGGSSFGEENLRTRPEKFKNQKAGSKGEGTMIKLVSNYCQLKSEWDTFVVLYDVQFQPPVQNARRRREYVKKIMEENGIQEVSFAYNRQAGLLLQGAGANRIRNSVEKSFAADGGHETCRITRARVIDQNDPEILFVLNNFKNRWLDEDLKLSMINRCHYNPKEKLHVSEGNIRVTLWPGFATAVGFHDEGILLNIDNRFKVIRDVTIMNLIDDGFNRNRSTNREEVKQNVQEEIIGNIVITEYSDKPRTYRVMGIDWNLTPATAIFEKQGKRVSLADYFKQQYNITLKVPHQPILLAEESGAARFRIQDQERKTWLLPELCKPTGLTDAMRENFRFMKEMANHTLQPPSQRMAKLYQFMEELLSNDKVDQFLRSWNLDFANDLLPVTGRQLKTAGLQQGGKKFTYDVKGADWTKDVRASKFHVLPRRMPSSAVLFIFPKRFDQGAQALWRTLCEVGHPMGIKFASPPFTQAYDNDRDVMEILRRHSGKKTELVIVILTGKTKARYDEIKLHLCRDSAAISQCIVQKTLEKPPMLRSVATKIAIQIGAKLGGAPWALDLTRFQFKHNIMCIGVDTFHDSGKKGGVSRSAVAVVGSLDNASTRFCSQVFFQAARQEISEQLGNSVAGLMDQYHNAAKEFPNHVVFFRDGVGAGQLETVYNNEVRAVVKAVMAKHPQAKVTFLVVTKRHNTRFVIETGNRQTPFDNPLPGTIVDQGITKPNRMDFYIVAQTVRQGTVAPTYYNVMHDDSNWTVDQLQQFTYAQCCMYFNWSGTVKVPAPCQYAHKLAFLIGQSIHDVPLAEMDEFLYYL